MWQTPGMRQLYRETGLRLFWAGFFLVQAPAVADDWPEWRGEGRRGVWSETGILERFPESGLPVDWRVPIGSGYGGPAVAQGRVFVTDFRLTEGNRGVERLLALSEETGEVLWAHEWEMTIRGLMPTYANGPRATPTVDGDRVYVLGSVGDLYCIDAATGSVRWRLDYVEDYGAEVPTWGMVAAPLVEGDRLFLLVGGQPDALVVAVDKRTGNEIWRALPTVTEPGYAPPVMVSAGSRRQLVVWTPDALRSLDPETGRVFWSFPYEVDLGQTIATPVFDQGRILVSSASHGSMLVRLAGDRPAAELVWKGESSSKAEVDGLHAFLATPFFEDDVIYGVGGLGFLRSIDAASGEELWKTAEPSEPARIATAFLVKNGDRFFLNNDRGELIIARLSPSGYEEIDRTSLIEPTNPNTRVRRQLGAVNWVHPAYANGHIVQRNDREILRAGLEARAIE